MSSVGQIEKRNEARVVKCHRQPFGYWVEIAIVVSVIVHLALFVDAGGGVAAIFKSGYSVRILFMIGILFGPHIVLWIGRTKYHSTLSRTVILCSAIGFSLFDLWGYFGGGSKQDFVVYGPIIILFPASLVSLCIAYLGREDLPPCEKPSRSESGSDDSSSGNAN